MNLAPVTALPFDLDGTLIDSTRDLAEAGNYLRALNGMPPLPVETVASYIGEGIEVLVSRLLQSEDRALLGRMVPEYMLHYRNHCTDHTRLYPGVGGTLAELSDRGYALGLVTNKPARISRRILDQLKVGAYFSSVVGGDSTEKKKPHPEPMRLAFEELGRDGAACAMVGDSWVDVRAARGVGIPALAVLGGIGSRALMEEAGPDLVLDNFADLLKHFPPINPAGRGV